MFPLLRSLRAKSVLAGLVPFALVLAVVAVIGVNAYDRVARNVVTQRDAELARVSAARRGERLRQHTLALQRVAANDAIRSLDWERVGPALAPTAQELFAFDEGVIVYDAHGVAIASRPLFRASQPLWSRFAEPSLLEMLRATLRPAFSNVLTDPTSGRDILLITVPVLDADGEFAGALTGMLTLRLSLLGATFAEVLELGSGRSGLAYLVDGRGRVIYHRELFRLGTDLSALSPVARVIEGETSAVIGDGPGGTEVIAGFAPVPGTGWGVVTQERWQLIAGPLRGYGQLLVALLGAGGLLSAALVFLAIGRTLRPIRDLTSGARRIAGGNFDRPIDTEIDHELRGLAEQFNTMAGALKESYADLEAKVEARTEEALGLSLQAERRADEIAAINLRIVAVADVAAGVNSILAIDELLTYVTGLLRTTFDYHTVYVFLHEPESNSLVLRAGAGGPQGRAPIGDRLELEEGISGWVARTGEAVLANDARNDPRFVSVEEFSDTRAQLSVPIKIGEEVLGVLGIEQTELNAFDETDQFTAQTIAHQLAVAIENARAKERLDVLNELMRIAVSSLDVAETFDGVRLQVQELIDHDRLSIDLRPADDEASELLAFAAAGPGFLERGAGMPIESPPGEVIRTGRAVLRTNFPEDNVYPIEFEFAERHGLRSFMFVPLRSEGNVIGSLNFASHRPGRYTAKKLQTAQQIADHLAVIVEHSLLYEESKEVTVLEERNRMAREIHDTLAQGFTGIVLQLEAAEQAHEQAAGAHDHGAAQARTRGALEPRQGPRPRQPERGAAVRLGPRSPSAGRTAAGRRDRGGGAPLRGRRERACLVRGLRCARHAPAADRSCAAAHLSGSARQRPPARTRERGVGGARVHRRCDTPAYR